MKHLLDYFRQYASYVTGDVTWFYLNDTSLLARIKQMIYQMPLEDIAEIRKANMMETREMGCDAIAHGIPGSAREFCRQHPYSYKECQPNKFFDCRYWHGTDPVDPETAIVHGIQFRDANNVWHDVITSEPAICKEKKAVSPTSPKFAAGQRVITSKPYLDEPAEFEIAGTWFNMSNDTFHYKQECSTGGYWYHAEESLKPAPKFKLKDRVRIPCAGYRNSEPWIVDVVSWYGNNIVYGLYRDGHRMDQPEDRLEADFPKHNFKKGDRVKSKTTYSTGRICGDADGKYIPVLWDQYDFSLMSYPSGLELIKGPKFKKYDHVFIARTEQMEFEGGWVLGDPFEKQAIVVDIQEESCGFYYRLQIGEHRTKRWIAETSLKYPNK